MKKEYLRITIECILVFSIIFIYNNFFYNTYDHIIDFTHCYSIANGLKIYKDFNIVVGPIYPVLISTFLKLFGKNLLVFNIVNSLFSVGIYLLIRKHNKRTLAILAIVCCYYALVAKYNVFTLLLFYIIYYIDKDDRKYKDYILGFLLSISIFTKINAGFVLIIPTIILNFKEPKIILKRSIVFSITSTLIVLIMYITGVLPGFINYTLLGLLSFNENKNYDVYIIFLLIAIIYIIINLRKDKYLIYMICYLIMAYPIFDSGHILLVIFPTFVYAIDKLKQKKESNIIQNVTIIISVLLFIILNISNINSIGKMDCKNKYCSQSISINNRFNNIHKLNKYLEPYRKEYRIFYLNYDAYFYKLDLNENIDKFDFIWNGNMGYKGQKKYINEIEQYCSNNKCMFIIDKENIYNRKKEDQINLEILKYIEKNYSEEQDDKYFNKIVLSIYTNNN